MNTVASRKRAIVALGSNFANQIILLPLSSAPCEATNRPCTWKIGSAWISTSPALPAPVVLQHQRIAQQVAVRQHRALAAPGGAAGVEDRRQVVGAFARRRVLLAHQRRAVEQAAAAVVAEREDVARAGLERQAREPGEVLRRAHHHGRFGVADEVFDLGLLVGGVQRQVHIARALHCEVEHQRLDALFGLHRHARAGRQLQRDQQVGQHRRAALEVAPGVVARRAGAVGGFDRGRVEVGGKGRAQRREQVRVAHHRAPLSRVSRRRSSPPRPSA